SETLKNFKGENNVVFEVMEIEKIKNEFLAEPIKFSDDVGAEDDLDYINEIEPETEIETVDKPEIPVEEINVITKLTMPSRKLKVDISNELLCELDKTQVDFKLN
ncbi:MAG TPA: hypothetical protein VLZ72_01640, partial [Flavobacterium sp.]|nr:hypothetical protein [Flavobacterium sp.]